MILFILGCCSLQVWVLYDLPMVWVCLSGVFTRLVGGCFVSSVVCWFEPSISAWFDRCGLIYVVFVFGICRRCLFGLVAFVWFCGSKVLICF